MSTATVERIYGRNLTDKRASGAKPSLFPCIDRARTYTGCRGQEQCAAWRMLHGLPPSCILEPGRRRPLSEAIASAARTEVQ